MPSVTDPERPWLDGAVGIALGVLLLIAPRLGLGFYTPPRGEIAVGEPQPGGREMPRDRATVRVLAEMAPAGQRPTLADVVRFYGLDEDAVRCTVEEAHGLTAADRRIEALSRRPLRVGDTVTVCLD